MKVYRRSPSPSGLTAPRGIAIFRVAKTTGCGPAQFLVHPMGVDVSAWQRIRRSRRPGLRHELTRGLVWQLRAATATRSIGVANSTLAKFRRHFKLSGSAVISSWDETFVSTEINKHISPLPVTGTKGSRTPGRPDKSSPQVVVVRSCTYVRSFECPEHWHTRTKYNGAVGPKGHNKRAHLRR